MKSIDLAAQLRNLGLTIASESTTSIVGAKPLISSWKLNHQVPRHLTNLQSPINQRNHRSSRPRKRRRWRIVVGIFVAAVLLFIGIPRLIRAFNTVSTDDAYVNGYVTFVAPRVSGQVTRVLVDNDNRVKKGRRAS